MNQRSLQNVPPAEQVRADLVAARTEVRALRKLLALAKEADQAKAARQHTRQTLNGREGVRRD